MPTPEELEAERAKREADEAAAKLAMQAALKAATEKHAKVIETTERDGLVKDQAATVPMRPSTLDEATKRYNAVKRQDASFDEVRARARANDPTHEARDALRKDNEKLVADTASPNKDAPKQQRQQEAKIEQAVAASHPQPIEQPTPAQQLEALRTARVPNRQAALDTATAPTVAQRMEALRLAQAPQHAGQAISPAMRMQSLREQSSQQLTAQQNERELAAQHARRSALGAQRYEPLREMGDRAQARAAREDKPKLEETEKRQSQINSGKARDKGEMEL